MGYNIAEKIIINHLKNKAVKPVAGKKIEIKIDQTLTQDATGTMAYIEFESLKMDWIQTELSVSYVDHNTLQTGFENADDHRFLRTFAAKYGIIFSPPGNGICHQLHLENFARPGRTMLGSDSHTPTSSALGMIAIGAGGLDIACALAGRPFSLLMPEVIRINLSGKLPAGVSAKDIVLYLLKKFTVKGGVNKIFEYSGPAVRGLNVYQRATICNMGTELGLTTSIFPSDEITKKFMKFHGREKQWSGVSADHDARYDSEVTIELDKLEPLIACPHSPDNVMTVREVAGKKVNQVCIGSCTNSSYYDLAMVARMLKKNKINPDVDLVISPGSKQVLSLLEQTGDLKFIIESGARILEPACGPCIGIGQAPQSAGVSLRTFNRNFKGRCGTQDADVYICSPEVAVASAITGKITSPGKLSFPSKIELPKKANYKTIFIMPSKSGKPVEILRGPNIKPLPVFDGLPQSISGIVLIKLGNNISTDDIIPGGSKILSLRSNLPAISEYTFSRIDPGFVERAKEKLSVVLTDNTLQGYKNPSVRTENFAPYGTPPYQVKQPNAGIIAAGENYGQGSSREHAAMVTRYLGVRVVIAKSFARIHLANLVNFGVLPVVFANPADYDNIKQDDNVEIDNIRNALSSEKPAGIWLDIPGRRAKIELKCELNRIDREIIISGGLLNHIKKIH